MADVVVVKGDTLWDIAERELGDGRRYMEIAEANGLSNANRLKIGQKLVIPGKVDAEMPTPRMRPSGDAPPIAPVSMEDIGDLRMQVRGQGLEGIGRPNPDDGGWTAYADMQRSMNKREAIANEATKRLRDARLMEGPQPGLKYKEFGDAYDIPQADDPIPEFGPSRFKPVPAQEPTVDERSGLNKLLSAILPTENLLTDLGLVDPNPIPGKDQSRPPMTYPDPSLIPQAPVEEAGYMTGGRFAKGGTVIFGPNNGALTPDQQWDRLRTLLGYRAPPSSIPGGGTIGVDMLSATANLLNSARQRRASGGFVGAIHSDVPGRTDRHPIDVPDGAYVIPADIVSGEGEGNTAAGIARLKSVLGDDGENMASGGPVVPIMAAGGEYIVSPQTVARHGRGDLRQGHRVLDKFVERRRQALIKTLRKLPGPVKDGTK